MRVRSLGSGSKGNSIAVRGGGELLLVDCGLSCLETKRRLAACGASIAEVTGVLFTVTYRSFFATFPHSSETV